MAVTVASFAVVAGIIVVVDFMVAAVVGAVGGTVVAGCVVVVVGSTTVVVSSTDVVPTEVKAALSYQHSCQLLKDKHKREMYVSLLLILCDVQHPLLRPDSIALSMSQTWSQTWCPTCRRQLRAILTCQDSSNLVADHISSNLVADWFRPPYPITLSCSLVGL